MKAAAACAAVVAAATVVGCSGSAGLSAAQRSACRSSVADGTGVVTSMQTALVAADAQGLAASLSAGASRLRADVAPLAPTDRVRAAVAGLAAAYARQATAVRGSGLVSTPLDPRIRVGVTRVSAVCRSAVKRQ